MCTYPHKKGYPHKTGDLKDLYYDVLQFVEKLPYWVTGENQLVKKVLGSSTEATTELQRETLEHRQPVRMPILAAGL